jgi:hypothetical protein
MVSHRIQIKPGGPLDVINMAKWLASRTGVHAIVRFAFSESNRLNRRKPPGKTRCLKLTQAERESILDHASLPDDLVARLVIEKFEQANNRFTVGDIDVLGDKVEEAAHYARGSVRRRLMRVVKKLSDIRNAMSNGTRYLFLR